MSPSDETEIKILFSFLIREVPFQLIILQTVYQFLYQIHSNSLPIGSTIVIHLFKRLACPFEVAQSLDSKVSYSVNQPAINHSVSWSVPGQ